jgi:hypothetical protein
MLGVRSFRSTTALSLLIFAFQVEAEPPLAGTEDKTVSGWFKRWKFRFQWMPSQGRPWWASNSLPSLSKTVRPDPNNTQAIVCGDTEASVTEGVVPPVSPTSSEGISTSSLLVLQTGYDLGPAARQIDEPDTMAPQFDL